jgi:hypothetical protein
MVTVAFDISQGLFKMGAVCMEKEVFGIFSQMF